MTKRDVAWRRSQCSRGRVDERGRRSFEQTGLEIYVRRQGGGSKKIVHRSLPTVEKNHARHAETLTIGRSLYHGHEAVDEIGSCETFGVVCCGLLLANVLYTASIVFPVDFTSIRSVLEDPRRPNGPLRSQQGAKERRGAGSCVPSDYA